MTDRQQIAIEMAADFYAAELAIDQAITATARLYGRLPELRVEAGLSATVGQPVFDAVAQTAPALAVARSHMVAAHREIDRVRLKMRLDRVTAGPAGDKPDEDNPRLPAFAVVEGGAVAA